LNFLKISGFISDISQEKTLIYIKLSIQNAFQEGVLVLTHFFLQFLHIFSTIAPIFLNQSFGSL